MHRVEAIIHDEIGLHARPANRFVKLASSFQSAVTVQKEGDLSLFNGKSITAVLRMGALRDNKIFISAEGEDAQAACAALQELVEHGLAE